MPAPFSIPQQGKVSIPNTGDIFGNIEYTKNINLCERGYIKLASRTAYILSQASDANFALPLSFGRKINDQFYIATAIKSYIANTLISNFFISADTGTNAPTATLQGFGIFWQSNWHVSDATYVWIKDRVSGNWTQAGAPFQFSYSGVSHMLEPFVSAKTLCAADGNLVHQLSTTYDVTTWAQLTLPTDFEVTAIKYNNYLMGIATKSSSLLSQGWQNKEAIFFTWDGGSGNASAGHSIGADAIICLVAYKSSWAMLTRRGRLLYFNGGGFDELGRLPFNYKNRIWADPIALKAYADCMTVEDDLIYINIPTQYNPFGKKGQQYQENSPGGILCYDPAVGGIYQRYSPSNSLSILLNVGAPSVVDGTFTSNQYLPATGNPIKYVNDPTNLIGGLTYNKIYYIIRIDSTHFKLANTYADAVAGNFIIPTSSGASTNSFLCVEVVDYGASYNPGNTGGIGITGQHTVLHDHLLFGSEVQDGASGNTYGVCNITLPDFKNVGYLVTVKVTASQLEEMLQKIAVKYKPLNTGDSVLTKVKTEDAIGLPVATPQYIGSTSWIANNQITTSCDLSDAYNYQQANPDNALECEIISGAGAGQMSQCTIAPSGGSYIITLTDILDGAVAGNVCNVKIDNWKLYVPGEATVTAGYDEVAVGTHSKFYKAKIILIGNDVTLESIMPISQPSNPA